MKKIIFIILCVVGLHVHAQDKSKHERIKALKVSFLTEQLELTPNEAEKFWPVYNVYDKQMDQLRRQERELYKKLHSRDGARAKLPEKEAIDAKDQYLSLLLEKYNLQKTLMAELQGKIPATKIVFLPEAERDFGKKLFEEYKKRHNKNKK